MKKTLLILSVGICLNPFSSIYAAPKADLKQEVLPQKNVEPPKTWLDNLSGTFDFTTNYVFRGISQTENLPAVQGGLTYGFPWGLYANVWGSNVKFSDPLGNAATVELDTIAGIHNEIGSYFSYDINLARYNYPRARGSNYNELNTLWNYWIFQLGLSYSGNAYGYHKPGTYYSGLITYDIPPAYAFHLNDISIAAGMGHYSLSRAAGNSYNDYIIGISKQLNKTYSISVQGTGTNGRQHNPPYDGNQIIGTVAANF